MKHAKTLRLIHDDPRVMERFGRSSKRAQEKMTAGSGRERSRRAAIRASPGQHSAAPGHLSGSEHGRVADACGRVQRLCENPRCVRPQHLAWIVDAPPSGVRWPRPTDIRTLPGVAVRIDRPRVGMPHVVRLRVRQSRRATHVAREEHEFCESRATLSLDHRRTPRTSRMAFDGQYSRRTSVKESDGVGSQFDSHALPGDVR